MEANHTNYYRINCLIFIVLVVAVLAPNSLSGQPASVLSVNEHDLTQGYARSIRHWYQAVGNDSKFSIQNLHGVRWESLAGQSSVGYATKIQWYRADIQLAGTQDEFDILALTVTGLTSAYELYWDGILVGAGGVVGSSFEEEVSGPIRKIFRLKREQTGPGNHIVVIRVSNFHNTNRHSLGTVRLGNHYKFLYDYTYKSSSRVFVGGAFLFAGLFCLSMFFAGSRHRSSLFFALFCFISLFFDVFTSLYLYNEISIDHIQWIPLIYDYGPDLSMLFFVTFVVYTYDLPRKVYAIPFVIIMALVSIWLKNTNPGQPYLNTELMPLLAAVLLLYSLYRGTTGSIAAFVGVLIWRIFKYPDLFSMTMGNHWFVYITGDIVFLFCIVLSISRMIHEENQQLQDVRMRSSRLEVDLLKKNIQPHFILNTLQSIMSWTKKKPENAALLIEALAEEFRMINCIADKKLIPLHQEIDLCNTHLKLMGFRKGSTYELVTNGLCEDFLVPPMIFHTLIENALTHSFDAQEGGTIHLACELDDKMTVYHLSNGGSRLSTVSRKSDDEIQEGMGLKYIKARLNESFFDKWSLDYTLDDDQWKVTIVIEHTSSV